MKILRLPIALLAFITVGFMRLIAPWKVIRIGVIWSERLGHLVGNLECYLSELDEGYHKGTYDIWFHRDFICNKYIAKKYDECLRIGQTRFWDLVNTVNQFFPGYGKHVILPIQADRDVLNLWGKYAPHIGFTKNEEIEGKKLLQKMCMPTDAKWVCLINRDSLYLKTKLSKMDYSYHDYRDSDISTYEMAALALTQRGYYVVRVGDVVAKPFLVKHPMIIDYATNGMRTEFGDLYLGAKCTFCLGVSCGFMSVSQAFNRPIAAVNYAPIDYLPTYSKGLTIWKHHIKDGKRLSIKEITEAGVASCTFGPGFEQAGITLEDNSPQEILDVAMEMVDLEDGKVPEDQTEFWKAFPRAFSNSQPLHGEIKIRIGREFLKGYQ